MLAPSQSGPPLLEELKASREIFRLLVDGTPDYAIFMLSPEGLVQTWNSGARRLKGYEADEVIGRHFSLFYPSADKARTAHELEVAVDQGRYEEEGWRVRKDGSRFWASVVITPIFDAEQRLTGFAKVTRDATERRIAEEALRAQAIELERRVEQRTAQLRRANEQLAAFAYSVSHDLRSPLLGLEGLAAAVLEDYGEHLDDLGREYLSTMISTARGLAELVQGLLTYSRLGAAEMTLQPIDPRSVLWSAVASLSPQLEENGGQVSVHGDYPSVMAHGPTLQQIFSNLIGNGLKFVPSDRRPEIRVEAEGRGRNVRFWVRDNGIGIPRQYHDKIFRVFERLHDAGSFPGSGVGLAIVAAGVGSMGGRVGLESEVGQGASFWFELTKSDDERSDPDRRG